MISLAKCHILVFVFSIICLVLGMVIQYYTGHTKCKHEWKKIYEGNDASGYKHVIIYMCTKCGKRKNTKI